MATEQQEIIERLRRVEGQIAGVRRMQEEGRYCIDVLDQISAVRAALGAVALKILEGHVDTCVRDAVTQGQGQRTSGELTAAVRRLLKSA
ncbi:MAG: metal-sensitive transcriptional regulator [Actinomycetota bacterium]